MPQFRYRGRDNSGNLRTGDRFSASIDTLNAELSKEGIFPIEIHIVNADLSFGDKVQDFLHGKNAHLQELSVFTRQMQLLHDANVPMITALKQLSSHTRSKKLAHALNGIVEHIQKGENLATGMQYYPRVFSPLMISIIQIGESSGYLSEAFSNMHDYIEFELSSVKQIRSAFRYPMFVLIATFLAILILNLFVIPTFARFYTNLAMDLPWQTMVLINTSNFLVNDGVYLLCFLGAAILFMYRYLQTPQGKYYWGKILLHTPLFGKLLVRITLIQFSQCLAIVLKSGLPILKGLSLAKNTIRNNYIVEQISQMQEMIERGVSFSKAISKVPLFTPLEIQILAVGEKNGEYGPALTYIANFHRQEIEYDLKRINDFIGPAMMAIISVLVLIIALGVYLPIWNMINLSQTHHL